MANDTQNDIVRVLNFQGTGDNDLPRISTKLKEYIVGKSGINERISYTISYPGGMVPDGIPKEKFAEKLTDEMRKSIKNHIDTIE